MMKKVYSFLLISSLSVALIACSNSKESSPSTTQGKIQQSTSSASSEESKIIRYPASQSKELSSTTYLFNGADVEVAKTIERYVALTSTYDSMTFDRAEADQRTAELKTLKVNGELAEDEVNLYEPVLQTIESDSTGSFKIELVELGIFKDTSASPDPNGLYDATYQVTISIATKEDGAIKRQSTMVGLIWTKGNLIQSSYSIADLQELVSAEEFFNDLSEE
ncbi:hypothetical protein K6V64_00455 [Streptococcus suis]|nr:hypothetical protein [Streptococcus suis]